MFNKDPDLSYISCTIASAEVSAQKMCQDPKSHKEISSQEEPDKEDQFTPGALKSPIITSG